MAVGTITLYSEALERPIPYTIFLPNPRKAGVGPYVVLLQLHGMHDDHNSWLHKSNLLRYTEKLPLIVVMPDGGNFFYGNPGLYLNYENYIVNDLYSHINSTYRVRQDAQWAIGGLSMGGYGALRLGLKYPQLFGSVFGHSSACLSKDELKNWDAFPKHLIPDMDIFALASRVDKTTLPRISFDCGTDDGLLGQNRRFHAHLEKLGIAHAYAEFAGGHTWDYWDQHVQTALVQHSTILGLSPTLSPQPDTTRYDDLA